MQNKRKSINVSNEILILLIICTIAIIGKTNLFAFAKYAIPNEIQVELNFKRSSILEEDITYVKAPDKKSVDVEIAEQPYGSPQYKIGEDGTWTDYTEAFQTEEETDVYVRLAFEDGYGAETKKEIPNIVEQPCLTINAQDMIAKNGLLMQLDGANNTKAGHYQDETIWKDLSGQNKNGNVNGATWFKKGLSFDGSDDVVTCGTSNTDYKTMEVTFSVNNVNVDQMIMGNAEKNIGGGGAIHINGGKIRGQYVINDNWYNLISDKTLEANKIYTVSLTYDGTKLKLYINGAIDSESEVSGTIKSCNTEIALGASRYRLGTDYDAFLQGKVYSARIYNRALTTEEVQKNYVSDRVLVNGTVSAEELTYTFIWNEAIDEFTASDITVQNGTKGTFTETQEDKMYTLKVTPQTEGELKVFVAADVCRNTVGSYNLASAVEKVTIVESAASITIGGTTFKFDTLDQAIKTAGSTASTITLLRNNIEEDVTIEASQDITINMNGKTLNGGTKTAITNNGNLTISGIGGTITSAGGATILNRGAVTVNNVSITIGQTGSNNAIDNYGVLAINGGTVISSGNAATIINSSNSGQITINSAAITNTNTGANSHAIYTNAQGGRIEINSGAVLTSSNKAVFADTEHTGTIEIKGGTITSANDAGVHVAKGTLILGIDGELPEDTEETPDITGATFGVKVQTGTFNFKHGIIKGQNGEGTAISGVTPQKQDGYVIKKSVTDGVETAKVIQQGYVEYNGDTKVGYYETLAEALVDVADGNTIKVLVSGTETTAPTLVVDKEVTINLNGKTVTLDGVTLTNNGNLTIKGSGELKGSGADTITNTGTLTVKSNVKNTSTSTYYAINNTGEVNVQSGTINSSNTAINNQIGARTIVSGGTVTATNYAIYNKAITTVIEGTITATAGTAIYSESGTVTLGVNEIVPTVNLSNPEVTGEQCGVEIVSGVFNYYDGVIKGNDGTGSAIHGTITNQTENYRIRRKTNNGIETVSLNAMTLQTLADVVAVGDYVNYDANAGLATPATYTTDEKTGKSEYEETTFSSEDSVTWRVLSVNKDAGTVELMAADNLPNNLGLANATGYINAKDILNDIGAVYGQGAGAIGGRSINLEDIEQYSEYDLSEYENDNSSTGYYGGTKTYNSEANKYFIDVEGYDKEGNLEITGGTTWTEDEDGITYKQGSVTARQTYYGYTAATNFTDSKLNLLFKSVDNTNINRNTYWLASRCVDLYTDNCGFGIHRIDSGDVGYNCLATSSLPNVANYSYGVVPVVTLKCEIKTNGQDDDDVWQLVTDTGIDTAYTIEYDLDGGTAGIKAPEEAIYGQTIQISNPTKPGYIFKGWTSEEDDGTHEDEGLQEDAVIGINTKPETAWIGEATTNQYFKNLRKETGTVTLTATWEEEE